jgi:hypothetical protein
MRILTSQCVNPLMGSSFDGITERKVGSGALLEEVGPGEAYFGKTDLVPNLLISLSPFLPYPPPHTP